MRIHKPFRLMTFLLLVIAGAGTLAATLTRADADAHTMTAGTPRMASLERVTARSARMTAPTTTSRGDVQGEMSMVIAGTALLGLGAVLRKAA